MANRPVARRVLVLSAILVALLQSAVLLYVVMSRAAVLRNGAEVVLETAPVDPRDLLRGDYVILNYRIGEIATSSIVGAWPQAGRRQPIHVRLVLGRDGFWTVQEASFEALPADDRSVVLRGLVDRVPASPYPETLSVRYGIERFYVPEGEGRAIEAARNDGKVRIAARVSANGTAHIHALLQYGKPLYVEPLY